MRHVALLNKTTGRPISQRVAVADTALSRFVSLLGRRGLGPGEGLLIKPSSGVHTIGMRFAIDVVALDKQLRVVEVWPNLKPYRMSRLSLTFRSMLELPAGEIARTEIKIGDQLEHA